MRRLFLLLALLAIPELASAGGVCHRYGTSLPPTCQAGECFLLTSVPRGWYDCTATDVWTVWGLLAVDDSVEVGNGLIWQTKVVPDCSTAGTSKLLYNATTNAFSCGTDQTGAGGSFSGIGACGANTWASTLNDNAAPTCTQPAFSNVSGAVTDAQVPNSITVDLATLATTAGALSADPSDCATSTHFAVGVTAGGVATCEAIADADVPNTITVDLATLATTATTANAGDSATGFFPGGAVEVSRGGTGAAPGADDQVLVSDSTSAATWRAVPNCTVATQKLLYDTATNTWSCQTDATGGGGGGGNSVEVSINLGDGQGVVYSTTVTGQAWVASGSEIICRPAATSADGQTVETYDLVALSATASNLVAGTGFDLRVRSPHGASGTFRIACLGV